MGGTFDVVLRSPLGPRWGTLTLCQNGALLTGRLSLLGTVNPITEGTVSGRRFMFSGSIATAVGMREYKAEGTVENGVLQGDIVFYLRTALVKIPLPIPMKFTGERKAI